MSARTWRIGVIAPFDMALDGEYWQLAPDGVSVHFTRLAIVDLPYGQEHARAVAEPHGLRAATETLVRIRPAVVAFACTSASFVDGVAGEARIRAAIESAGVPHATTASGALVEALHERGVTRVAIGTPYQDALGERLREFLEEAGFEPGSVVNLGFTDEEDVIGASPEVVEELARAALFPGAEAIFLACTNLPTVGILARLEADLGVPVLSANQVLMEASLRRLDPFGSWDGTGRHGRLSRAAGVADVAPKGAGTDGGVPVVGILYPGHSAESDYRRAGELVGERPASRSSTRPSAATRTRFDALMDTGAAWRLEEGWATLRAARPAAVMWACTSGSFVFGLEGARDQARRLGAAERHPGLEHLARVPRRARGPRVAARRGRGDLSGRRRRTVPGLPRGWRRPGRPHQRPRHHGRVGRCPPDRHRPRGAGGRERPSIRGGDPPARHGRPYARAPPPDRRSRREAGPQREPGDRLGGAPARRRSGRVRRARMGVAGA